MTVVDTGTQHVKYFIVHNVFKCVISIFKIGGKELQFETISGWKVQVA